LTTLDYRRGFVAKVTSVRLSDEVASQLDQLASSLDRPKSWLIEQAIARYVEEEAWQIQAISGALDRYRRGEATVRPHDEVMDRMEAKIRRRMADEHPMAR
jgi:predicted transcriptional regulator